MENCKKTAFFAKTTSPRHFREAKFFRPDDSENVVLFERATFLTGVIAAQSRNMSVKLKASRKLGGVKKKSHGHNFWNFYESSRQIQENYIILDLMMTIPMFLNCKQRLLTIYFDIQASTFNPLGSLSSTDNNTNKKEKLQKVKVRNKK